jgi:cyanophycinase
MFDVLRKQKKENTHGNLYLIGGHEDKSGEMKVLRFILQDAGVKQVTLIPTASSVPRDLSADYERAFRDLELEQLDVLDIRTSEEANRDEYLEVIYNSELVFFTGGDQVHLLERLGNTKLFTAIRNKWLQGMPIAGTSAGAAAMSKDMIYDGDGIGLLKGTVCHMQGFGFLPEFVVDTHFDVRSRLPRISQALAAGYAAAGIGLSEDTGLLISPDHKAQVFGQGYVALINKAEGFDTNYQQVAENAPWSAYNLNFSMLYAGDTVDMTTASYTCHIAKQSGTQVSYL